MVQENTRKPRMTAGITGAMYWGLRCGVKLLLPMFSVTAPYQKQCKPGRTLCASIIIILPSLCGRPLMNLGAFPRLLRTGASSSLRRLFIISFTPLIVLDW